jgi:hypothetical protein
VMTTPSKRIRPSVYGTFWIAKSAYTILKDRLTVINFA